MHYNLIGELGMVNCEYLTIGDWDVFSTSRYISP